MIKTHILFAKSKEKNSFNNVLDFINWAIKEKEKKLIVESKIDEIKSEDIIDLYNFINFYKKVKPICEKTTQQYNKKLLNQKYEEVKEATLEFTRLNKDGKYLRATLVGLGYQSTNKNDNYYKNLASALEIFQTSILIHDDIIDNAKIRRGKETIPVSYARKYQNPVINKKSFKEKQNNFSNSMGICIGDLGFYIANQIIIKTYKDNPNFSKLLEYYNNVVIDTCKGEMLDIILPFKEEYFETNKNLENKIMEIYKLKTAWYSVIGPYCLGLILGGAKENQIKKMEDILLEAGVAFQIGDDLLGVYGDEKQIGKSITSDLEEYKQTILYSYTMNTKYKDELLGIYGKKANKKDIEKVKEIFEKSGAKKYAENKMIKLYKNSEKRIDKLTFITENNKSVLKGFIIYLKNRNK